MLAIPFDEASTTSDSSGIDCLAQTSAFLTLPSPSFTSGANFGISPSSTNCPVTFPVSPACARSTQQGATARATTAKLFASILMMFLSNWSAGETDPSQVQPAPILASGRQKPQS